MDDNSKINNIINLYFDSMYESNEQLVKKVFHSDANITGYVGNDLLSMNRDEFASFVGDQQPSAFSKKDPKMLEVVSLKVAGNTAVALVRDDYLGNTYLDTLSFIKINEDWLIYNKLFHIEK
tara:strand:- start:210 stop:575 length:366 start_codon:yes stop_codon:yes gene_type:complete